MSLTFEALPLPDHSGLYCLLFVYSMVAACKSGDLKSPRERTINIVLRDCVLLVGWRIDAC
jgi:hypothetical protein